MIKIAYKNLQHYRYTVHKYLDGIWCFGNRKGVARTNMYKWLAVQMNLPLEDTHVKYFTRAQCKKAISILRPKYIQINGHDLVYVKKKKKKKNKINKEDKRMAESRQVALEFLEENKSLVQHLIEDEHYTYLDIVDYFSQDIDMKPWWVGEFSRRNKFCAFKNRSYSKLGDKNPSKKPEVRQKISDSVKKLWEDGVYKDSHIGEHNGMYDKRYMLHHMYDMTKYYREKLLYYSTNNKCDCCGCDLTDKKFDIHHVDEDHKNCLITNLEKLCVECHKRYHLQKYKQPYVTVEIQHEIQYGHRLPGYDGKCYFTHGHRGLITVRVRRRINPDTGFAIDFNDLKPIIKSEIDDVLDHEFLNNYLKNPTTEFTCIWLWNKLSPHLKGIQSITFAEGSKTQVTLTASDMLDSVKKGLYEVEWIPEEYRKQYIKMENPNVELTPIDESDDFTISANIDNNPDFKWLYDYIVAVNKDLNENKEV